MSADKMVEIDNSALKKRLSDNQIAFDDRVMKKYKGIFFKSP